MTLSSALNNAFSPKKRQKNQEMARLWMCAQHHLLGIPTEGQHFELFHCAKVGLDSRRYVNQRALFFLVLVGKEKRFISKMLIFGFLKRG